MALQYPLLFPYTERGFQLGVKYIKVNGEDTAKRQKMTMQDFYCFCSHYKEGQHNPYLCCGLLSDQAIVDSRACIDECRLHFILLSNDDLRSENLQGLVDAVGAGRMDGTSVGKKTYCPLLLLVVAVTWSRISKMRLLSPVFMVRLIFSPLSHVTLSGLR
jgi:hypothetical protein